MIKKTPKGPPNSYSFELVVFEIRISLRSFSSLSLSNIKASFSSLTIVLVTERVRRVVCGWVGVDFGEGVFGDGCFGSCFRGLPRFPGEGVEGCSSATFFGCLAGERLRVCLGLLVVRLEGDRDLDLLRAGERLRRRAGEAERERVDSK